MGIWGKRKKKKGLPKLCHIYNIDITSAFVLLIFLSSVKTKESIL